MFFVPSLNKLNLRTNPHLRLIVGQHRFYNLREILTPAREHHFGVGAINCRRLEIATAVLNTAFKLRAPVIIEIAESESEYCAITPKELADHVLKKTNELTAKYDYYVPICLHLDHLKNNFNLIDQAIMAGFSSVAADQSHYPLEKNIEMTQKVVKKCHPLGVSVEGEIGEIQSAAAGKEKNLDANLNRYLPTVPEVVKFVSKTKIDAFAGFFGNLHGEYLETPIIAWQRIIDIASAIDIPVVMHGGSYLHTEDFDELEVFRHAIKCGCHKFNYSTKLSDIFKAYLPAALLQEMENSVAEPRNWRKALGPFKEKIDRLDPEKLKNAEKAIENHLELMMTNAWLSKDKLRCYKS